jgi:hypothetical protein
MFSYLGSKSKIAHLYPKPLYPLIIEPFAGSARYSLLHWKKDVILFDTSKYVIGVWQLLQAASKSDILSLPDVPSKLSITQIEGLSEAEQWLIGFHLCRGKAKPRVTGHGQNSWNRDKIRIANDLYKVQHWQVIEGSYRSDINLRATRFVDPPYEAVQVRPKNSDRYPEWFVDYDDLAEYCRTRRGQTIVCEGDGANWLPFRLLKTVTTNSNNRTVKTNGEYIWTANAKHNFPAEIIYDIGHSRSGWGKAANAGGESRLAKLACGHNQFIPRSRWKGVGSFVNCRKCEREANF